MKLKPTLSFSIVIKQLFGNIMSKENLKISQKGIQLLQEHEETLFNQKQIVENLEDLGYGIAKASLNNVIHYEKRKSEGRIVGKPMLKKIAYGLQLLILHKLKMTYDKEQEKFLFQEGVDKNLPIFSVKNIPKKTNLLDGVFYHIGGRRDEEDKILLMRNAQPGDIIIELGLRLRNFSSYFITRRDDKFKNHIEKLLASGIHLHCFLLNPSGIFAELYFKDRAKEISSEIEAYKQMPLIIENLKKTRQEFNSKNYKGKMELFQYDSTPQYHALVSGDKMFVTHYIYGVERRNGPVLEIHKAKQPELFKKYNQSINAIRARAVKIA